MVYVITLVIGAAAMTLRLYCMSYDQEEAHDLHCNLIMEVATMLSVFCSSYLYAFTVAPIANEGSWLIYMVIGLLPVILDFNNHMIACCHQC